MVCDQFRLTLAPLLFQMRGRFEVILKQSCISLAAVLQQFLWGIDGKWNFKTRERADLPRLLDSLSVAVRKIYKLLGRKIG